LLRVLGEDHADFHALEQELSNQETATAALQKRLGKGLTHAFRRMERAVRMQDGIALRQAKEEEQARQGRLHMQMMRLKINAGHWQWLAQKVANPYYVTTQDHLQFMRQLHKDGAAKEMSEFTLTLFYQLREPGSLMPGDPGFQDEEQKDAARRALIKVKEIFALNTEPPHHREKNEAASDAARAENSGEADTAAAAEPANPHPEITPQEWAAREPIRQLLENLLARQVEAFEAQHHELMRESVAGPSLFERAAVIAHTHPQSHLMQKMEDAESRRVLRMSNAVIRLQRHEKQMKNLKLQGESKDVEENKVVRGEKWAISWKPDVDRKGLRRRFGTNRRGDPKK